MPRLAMAQATVTDAVPKPVVTVQPAGSPLTAVTVAPLGFVSCFVIVPPAATAAPAGVVNVHVELPELGVVHVPVTCGRVGVGVGVPGVAVPVPVGRTVGLPPMPSTVLVIETVLGAGIPGGGVGAIIATTSFGVPWTPLAMVTVTGGDVETCAPAGQA
jgi:hypothetical protein